MKMIDVNVLKKHGFVLAKVKTDKSGEVIEFITVQPDDAPTVDLDQIKKEWAAEIFEEVEKCVIGTLEPSFIQLRDRYIERKEAIT